MKTKKTKTLTALFLMAALTVGSFQSTQVTLKAKETEIEWNKATAKKYSWLTKKGYKLVGTVGNGLLKISNKKGDKFGLAKKDKTILYKPKFDYISEKASWTDTEYVGPEFKDGLGGYIKAGVYDLSKGMPGRVYDPGDPPGTYGLLNKNGEEVLPFEYEEIGAISEGLISVKKDGLSGYLNEKLEAVIPIQYEEAYIFYNGYASVKKDGKYGMIDKMGNLIIPYEYDEGFSIDSDINDPIIVIKDGKYGAIDKSGKTLISFKYDFIQFFSKGLYTVNKGKKYGIVNDKDEVVLPIKYDDYFKGNNPDFIVAKRGEKFGAININNKVKLSFTYDSLYENLTYDVFHFVRGGKYGVVDKKGKIIVPVKYDEDTSYEMLAKRLKPKKK